jgi:tetratricopeptide (TPR) repeat protein
LTRLQTVAVGILSALLLAAGPGSAQALQNPAPAVPGGRLQGRSTENQLDADETLFTVMAAINAAGYDAGANSASAHPLRAFIRQQLADKDLPSIRALKSFYADHKHGDPAEDLSQYISFALSVGGPPDFQFLAGTSQLPPDVRQLSELPTILSLFYDEAEIADLWKQSQPAIDEAIGLYHAPLAQEILEANAYLRSETSGVLGHRFQVFVDLLAAPGEIQARNYRTDTFVVMTPSVASTGERTEELAAEQIDDARHAYLHSLLDPLSVRYYQELETKQDLQDIVKTAPALDPMYKDDFLMLATECLIKAIEARLSHGPAEKRNAMVTEALHEGFILTPAFYDGLSAYEKQEVGMRLYYPDLVKAINVKAEKQRLASVQFATARAKRSLDAARSGADRSNAEKLLAVGEELSDERQLDLARAAFQKSLEEPPQPKLRARAYFGLARIAVLRKDPETAEKMFLKAIDSGPDGEVGSWAYYYLGRLEDAADERDAAVRYYRLAVDTPGGAPKAKDAAQKALDGGSTPKNGSK